MDPSASISYEIVVACCFSIVLSVLFFGLRLLSRWLQEHKFDTSDLLLGIGLLVALGFNADLLWATKSPTYLGMHMDPQSLSQATGFARALVTAECVYMVSLACVKLSFLFLYARIFPGRKFRWAIYATGLVIIGWAIALFFAGLFQCRPVSALWDVTLRPTATCFSSTDLYIGIWVRNITTDLIIFALPQWHVWKLQVSLKTKFALTFTFMLGGFAIIASIFRFTTIWTVDLMDGTWTFVPIGIWSSLELGAAIVSASLPTLRPLLLFIRRKKGSTATGSKRSNQVRSPYHKGYRLSSEPVHNSRHGVPVYVSKPRQDLPLQDFKSP